MLANKGDVGSQDGGKLTLEELGKVLQLEEGVLRDHAVHTVSTNGLNGAGLDDGFSWLRTQVLMLRAGDGDP